MIARVVTKRDDARLAIVVSLAAVLALVVVLIEDVWGKTVLGPPSPSIFALVAVLIALGGIAPWLAWTRRGRAVHVTCEDGVVRAGDFAVSAGEVSALSVASGARGRSVAISRGKKTTFLEVERAEDAARIGETLGVKHPPLGGLPPKAASRLLAVPQGVITLVTLVFAPLYYLAASGAVSLMPFVAWDAKAFFGFGGVIAAGLSTLLLAARRLAPGQAVAVGRGGAWDAHVSLHVSGAAETRDDADEEKAVRPRIGNLERGEEGVGAWLARLDAIPTEQHAYRGDAMKKDVLWEMLGDDGAPVDARMGAARLLRKRYGEEEGSLVRVVDDPDVRLRVEAALEDQEDAERTLATLGPLFRAR